MYYHSGCGVSVQCYADEGYAFEEWTVDGGRGRVQIRGERGNVYRAV